jgi:hypothetical protein
MELASRQSSRKSMSDVIYFLSSSLFIYIYCCPLCLSVLSARVCCFFFCSSVVVLRRCSLFFVFCFLFVAPFFCSSSAFGANLYIVGLSANTILHHDSRHICMNIYLW